MTATSRRLAASLALALPATFLAGSLAAPGFAAAAPATSPTAFGAKTADAGKRGDWRWRDYVAQKPVWKTATCTKASLALAKGIPAKYGLRIECAVVRTPLSWSDLSKGSMRLGMTRLVVPKKAGVKAGGAAKGRRLLMVNPGGPGMRAGVMVPMMAAKPALLATHQIVGVDPRGVGLSGALQCPAVKTPSVADPRANLAKTWEAVAASSKAFVASCVKAQGKVLPYITTTNTVHDMDFARRLMGYPTTDWYGVSGGTWMGAWLNQLHPKTVRRVVLDANTQFTTDWRTSFAAYPMGFDRRYHEQFLPWVARANAKYKLGSTTSAVSASYERIRAAAAKGKVKGLPPVALDALTMAMQYEDGAYPLWAGVLADLNAQLATKGNATPKLPRLMTAADPSDTSTAIVRTSILCNDTAWPRGEASYKADFLTNMTKYPMVAYLFSSSEGSRREPLDAVALRGQPGQPRRLPHGEHLRRYVRHGVPDQGRPARQGRHLPGDPAAW